MKFLLFTEVALSQNIPEYSLKKGAVGTIVEYYSMPEDEEDGYSLEGLISQDTVEVSKSQIEPIAVSVSSVYSN
ncbi:DUF4926 domain-containing protein [Iningainema tapete]|uniref:DUF4926 domain-containing protein n=1 Tax=Iningainema tapete BLCC-T55 TaxID=2748662 RepID=A0A8J6Y0G4_9CYAN|nr:DUF4926 domain-containing protein [Iningainema tapete]MBD2776803.1 DUF4926 domain-containing protein [Iningainema tapete BLCC-T55]